MHCFPCLPLLEGQRAAKRILPVRPWLQATKKFSRKPSYGAVMWGYGLFGELSRIQALPAGYDSNDISAS
jgi:hypothetical protein